MVVKTTAAFPINYSKNYPILGIVSETPDQPYLISPLFEKAPHF